MANIKNVEALLSDLQKMDIRISAVGDRLKVDAPKGSMSRELRSRLTAHKADLLQYYRENGSFSAAALRNDVRAIWPAVRTERIDASFAQQRLWFLDRLEGKNHTYTIPIFLRATGELHLSAFTRAVNEIIRRHEVLRSVFAEPEGSDNAPYQVILPELTLDVPVIDLTDLPEAERKEKIQAIAHETATQPFDLSIGSLIRLTVVRAKEQEHLLLFSVHHIVFDGLSVAIFLKELSALYEAFLQGQPSPLAALEIQYADFSVWQKKRLTSNRLADQLKFWQKHLEGAPPLLELPTDRPRPPVQTFQGARQYFVLNQELTESLRVLSREHNATLFMTLYAAFATLMARYTDNSDLVIGTPIANRNHAQIESLIGFFVNTLALRCHVTQDLPFTQLLQQVKATALQAYKHQALPFEKLINELQIPRSLGHNPLVQVMFTFQDAHTTGFTLPGLTFSPLQFDYTVSKFDLTLIMHEATDTLGGIVEYNTDLFDATTIERLIGHFQGLVQGIVDHPSAKISHLPLLTQSEAHKILVEFNATETEYPNDKCLHQLFEAQVEKRPDAVALVFGDEEITYRELNRRANQLAHYLHALGVAPDVLVGICVERSIEMVVGLLAILKAGGAYVPLDPTYPQERLAFMLADASVSLLLTQQHLQESLPTTSARLICLDSDWTDIAKQNSHISTLTGPPPSQVQPHNLAYVIYTSGSTGQPKGAMNNHTAIVNRIVWMQNEYKLLLNERVLQKTPFSFDVSVWEFFWPLLYGSTLVVARPEGHKDPQYLIDIITQMDITTIHFVPSMLQQFIEAEEIIRCTSLKRIICSGEALPFDLMQRTLSRLDAELHNLYGPTEAAIDVSHWACVASQQRQIVPIGRPVANTQLYIVDASLQPVPIGIAGELLIGGVQVARGYHKRPALTAEKFIRNPFGHQDNPGRLYKTGDLARWLPDTQGAGTGNIEFLGRIDHQVKIRGFRVELGEIEVVLGQYLAVQEVVVMAREQPSGQKRLVAYLTPQLPTSQLSDLRDYLKEKLPDYMIPSAFVMLDQLPLTPNGKINRKALPEPEITYRTNSYLPPRDSLELRLVQLWEKLLGISPISVLDNFFESGGDSLLAIRLISNIKQEFGIKIPLHTLFQSGTVEQLASMLRGDSVTSEWSPLVCLQSHGAKAPLFCVHAAGGIVFRYLQVAALLGKERPFYGIQSKGVEPGDPFYASIEEMAADYVDAVRRVQAKGPYLLTGWSFGGTVAFEMARQLEEAGETVPLLIMIDAPSPFVDTYEEDDVEFLLERLRPAAGLALEQLDLQTSRATQLAYLFNEQRLAGLFAPDIDNAYAQHRLNLHKHHNKIMCQYRPSGPFDGKIIFFKPTEAIPFDTKMKEPTVDWPRFALGGFEVHDAPGNHFNMFSPTNGPVLAEKMKACIETFEFELTKA